MGREELETSIDNSTIALKRKEKMGGRWQSVVKRGLFRLEIQQHVCW